MNQVTNADWIPAHAFVGTSRENPKLLAHLADDRTPSIFLSYAP
jgi:hypothetical protein